ncbi:6676_t:CDS:1, partial [Dentiscutata heterogama]
CSNKKGKHSKVASVKVFAPDSSYDSYYSDFISDDSQPFATIQDILSTPFTFSIFLSTSSISLNVLFTSFTSSNILPPLPPSDNTSYHEAK